MTMTETDRRKGRSGFDDLNAALAAHEYPITTADPLEVYGDHELDLPNRWQTHPQPTCRSMHNGRTCQRGSRSSK